MSWQNDSGLIENDLTQIEKCLKMS